MKWLLVFPVFFLFCIFPVFSVGYHANLVIDVGTDGSVSIEGESNYPDFASSLITQEYSSKKGKYWLVNITTQEEFAFYVYELRLPENSEINYIKTTPAMKIIDDGRLTIFGEGKDKPFLIVVQYQTHLVNSEELSLYILSFIAVLLASGVGGFMFVFLKRKRRRSISTASDADIKELDVSLFPQRQQKIIRILQERGIITQKELEELMHIPKSSFSRNLRALEIKGIVEKEDMGMVHQVFLKKQR